MAKWEQNEEIQIFREYLQIASVHPNIDYGNIFFKKSLSLCSFVSFFVKILYIFTFFCVHFFLEPCVLFLKKQAKKLNLPIAVHYPANEKCPVVVITWEGTKPDLPSIVLNSHMDVVPVEEKHWKHPPFGAEIDEDGNIYARGAQDDKSCGMQYLAAIRALQREGIRLQRTIHVTFVPDEETGGIFGMKAFVSSDAFKAMNVGFAMDESCAVPFNKMLVFHAERTGRG